MRDGVALEYYGRALAVELAVDIPLEIFVELGDASAGPSIRGEKPGRPAEGLVLWSLHVPISEPEYRKSTSIVATQQRGYRTLLYNKAEGVCGLKFLASVGWGTKMA